MPNTTNGGTKVTRLVPRHATNSFAKGHTAKVIHVGPFTGLPRTRLKRQRMQRQLLVADVLRFGSHILFNNRAAMVPSRTAAQAYVVGEWNSNYDMQLTEELRINGGDYDKAHTKLERRRIRLFAKAGLDKHGDPTGRDSA